MRYSFAVAAALSLALVSCGGSKTTDLASYVDPFIGASTNTDAAGVYHGLGKTFPGATVIKLDRDRRGYDLKLNNGMELEFNKKFEIVDIDD